jgi:hypothetical protein
MRMAGLQGGVCVVIGMAPRAFAQRDGINGLLIGDERRAEHEDLLPEMKKAPEDRNPGAPVGR